MKRSLILILILPLMFCVALGQHKASELMRYQILTYEGFRASPDSLRQIGYGHKMVPREDYDTITVEMADSLFELDIWMAERGANWLLEDANYQGTPPQHFFDALVSIVYAIGYSNLRKTEFFARLCRCRYSEGVIDESDWNWTLRAILDMANYDAGHARRRQNEYTIARYGRYEGF